MVTSQKWYRIKTQLQTQCIMFYQLLPLQMSLRVREDQFSCSFCLLSEDVARDSDEDEEDDEEEAEAGEEDAMETRSDRSTLIEKYYVSCHKCCW